MMVLKWLSITMLILFICCSTNVPEISLSGLVDGSDVDGIVRISVTANDKERLESVALYLDDSLLCMRDSSFTFGLNTYLLNDSSTYKIFAWASDYGQNTTYSDTFSITIKRGTLNFTDGFETYHKYEYPISGGWTMCWVGDSTQTYVDNVAAYSGTRSFCLTADEYCKRADGVGLYIDSSDTVMYHVHVMIPASGIGDAFCGFIDYPSPGESYFVNTVLFNSADSLIHVKGAYAIDTISYEWEPDSFYSIIATLDYNNDLMMVYIDNHLIAGVFNIAPRNESNIFGIGASKVAFFDEISVTRYQPVID